MKTSKLVLPEFDMRRLLSSERGMRVLPTHRMDNVHLQMHHKTYATCNLTTERTPVFESDENAVPVIFYTSEMDLNLLK